MAMKKRAVPPKKHTNDDTVIYKVMAALGILCILLLTVQMLSRWYVQIDYLFPMMTVFFWLAIVLAVAAVALAVLWRTKRGKSRFWRAAGLPLFILTLLLAVTFAVLYATWVEYVTALYVVYIAAAVLYMIALLYQHEFFLLSLLNVCAGAVFFRLYQIREEGVLPWQRQEVHYGPALSTQALLLIIGLVVVILAATSLMFFARRKGGKLKLFGKQRQLFSSDASALLLYISSALWILCLIASALLGATFAYYCIFAVAVFELIAAVYYTLKLS